MFFFDMNIIKVNLELFTKDILLGEWDKKILWQSKPLKVPCYKHQSGIIIIINNSYVGFYDHTVANEMLEECKKMYNLNHPNILSLIGVCIDGGSAPYIVMPFMAHGSLLAYVKKHRNSLVVPPGQEQDVSGN